MTKKPWLGQSEEPELLLFVCFGAGEQKRTKRDEGIVIHERKTNEAGEEVVEEVGREGEGEEEEKEVRD